VLELVVHAVLQLVVIHKTVSLEWILQQVKEMEARVF
jgi:hypothetical protein